MNVKRSIDRYQIFTILSLAVLNITMILLGNDISKIINNVINGTGQYWINIICSKRFVISSALLILCIICSIVYLFFFGPDYAYVKFAMISICFISAVRFAIAFGFCTTESIRFMMKNKFEIHQMLTIAIDTLVWLMIYIGCRGINTLMNKTFLEY